MAKTPKNLNKEAETIKAIRQEYLQLHRELNKFPAGPNYFDMLHTHSKLGCYLEEVFGAELWRRE